MKLSRLLTVAAAGFLLTAVAHGADTVCLAGKSLEVTVDTKFPRLIQYRAKADGARLEGQPSPVSTVELNGQPQTCAVAFKQLAADLAEYRLKFQTADIGVTLRLSVGTNFAEWRVTEVREGGAVKLKSFSFPGNALLTLRSSEPSAAIAAVRAEGYGNCRERIGAMDGIATGTETENYFFLSAGSLAAGICGNHIDDCRRVLVAVTEKDGVKTCAAQNPLWQYREIDGETLPLPWVRVLITGDVNGDGRANWQDAALACREALPRPFGAEFVRSTVGDQIAMDFASLAQQPFLRILDEVKKASLITDGLGQSVLIKGFTAEGHDSANTDYGGHYNERAGGLKDLNFLLARLHEYHARGGVHINTTEAYPEAHRYTPDILQRDGRGNFVPGWAWLDQSHLIDKRKDLLTGNLFAALDQMRVELPKLDFVYVDTYGDHGWNAWKLAAKLNRLELPIYTEFSTVFDPWSVWSHNRSFKSRIFRFLWFSDRDLCHPDPLLRGADHIGFLGWQGERDMNGFLHNTFGRNLPTKFLQNFPLLRWEEGREAVFGGGVKIVKNGDAATCTQDGRVVMTWTGNGANNRLFIPWEPNSAQKIYVWDEVGTEQTWELPPAWKNLAEVYRYRLTDLGRADETRLPVTAGHVTITAVKDTPFVLYPAKAPAQEPVVWGEGSLVKDPGFDSQGFAYWKPEPASADIRVEDDARGNSRLLITGAQPGRVAQVITGLQGGQTYAASVWVQVQGGRLAAIQVQPLDVAGVTISSNFVTRTEVRNRFDSDSKLGTFFQRLKVTFDQPVNSSRALLTLLAGSGDAACRVEFDDVRVVPTARSPEAAKHYFWEDFEHVDQGWGPFVYACGGQTQTHLSERHEGFTDDTINGNYSFKTLNEPAGEVVRTLPSFLRFKPFTQYRLTLEYLTDTADVYRLVVQSREGAPKTVRLDKTLPRGRGQFSESFSTGAGGESFLALVKNTKGGGKLVLDDIAVDELGPAAKTPDSDDSSADDDRLPGRSIMFEENFERPLTTDWRVHVSTRNGTALRVADGKLSVAASANLSACAERGLPAGVTAVECEVENESDHGETWGAGLALFWPGGQALRVNLRPPDHGFGVDSTAGPQLRTGSLAEDSTTGLRIRLAADQIIAEARNENEPWQTLAAFPREKFPGSPDRVRLGKMHGIEGLDDYGDPGSAGNLQIQHLRVYK